jgi:hypothetical protein
MNDHYSSIPFPPFQQDNHAGVRRVALLRP